MRVADLRETVDRITMVLVGTRDWSSLLVLAPIALLSLVFDVGIQDWVETWIFNAPKCQAIFR